VEIVLYADPSCPFTWNVARWLVDTVEGSEDQLTLRSLSLGIVNEGNAEVPAEYAAQQVAARRVLRVVEAARAAAGDGAALQLYLEAASRFHREGDTRFTRLDEAVEAAGLPPSVLDAADDARADDALRAAIDEAREVLGGDAASPVVLFPELERGFWGPVLTDVPADGRAFLDAVVTLASTPSFSQIKAPMRGALVS
jgi:hypothetical protein